MRGLGRLFGLGGIVAACGGESPGVDQATEADTAAKTSVGGGSTGGDEMSDASGTTSSGAGSDEASTGESGGPFPGCGRDPGLEGVTVGSMEVAGMQRSFVLRLPDDYDPTEPLALVFGFHGRGGTAELFRSYSGLEQSAPQAAVFVYPQGLPIASMGGQSGWDLDPNGHDVAFVSQLLDELAMNLCIDPARVYATGHSFGGYFSNTLGCGLADRLRAIGPVAGGGPFGSCPQPMAAIVIHGLDDEVVPTSAGEASRDHWRSNNGCGADTEPAEPGPCVAYQGCDPEHGVVWCLHEEAPPGIGTHTWPSFAADSIWSFFVAHGA